MSYTTEPTIFKSVRIAANRPWIDPITDWFMQSPISRPRLIVDDLLESTYAPLADVKATYPACKTFTVVMNPFYRMVELYRGVMTSQQQDPTNPALALFNVSSFDAFIASSDKFGPANLWFNPILTPQTAWIHDGQGNTVDYIIRLENFAAEFKPLQDFFETTRPAMGFPALDVDYRVYYTNATTRASVEAAFQSDLTQFGYSF